MTRAERVTEAQRLRGEGLLFRQIAARMGVATSTVSDYLNDPDGLKLRARNDTRFWTRQRVVAAIREFARRYGRQPAATDFNPTHARRIGHEWRAERFYADGDYPDVVSAQRAFGSWNAAIVAAGFEPRPADGTYERVAGSTRSVHLAQERVAA